MAVNLDQIGTRLSFYMSIKGLGIYEMGVLTGTSANLISSIIAGKNYLMDDLLLVLSHLQDLNPHWVIYGDGNIFKEEQHTPAEADTSNFKRNRLKHLQEIHQLMTEINKMEQNATESPHIASLKARILELTKTI